MVTSSSQRLVAALLFFAVPHSTRRMTVSNKLVAEVTRHSPQQQVKESDFAYTEVEMLRAMPDARSDPPMEPLMSRAERYLFYQLIGKATNYEEFGSGGSTVVALKRDNIKRIHTVESAKDWITMLSKRKDVSGAISNGRMKFVHADIGPTASFGNPKNDSHKTQWPAYSGSASEDASRFDLVFVDGRFCVACILKALQRVPPEERRKVTFAMHDYTNRQWYHVVEEFLNPVERSGTLQVFQAKPGTSEAALQKRIAEYEFIQA